MSVSPFVCYHTVRSKMGRKRYERVQCYTDFVFDDFYGNLCSKVIVCKPSEQAKLTVAYLPAFCLFAHPGGYSGGRMLSLEMQCYILV